MYFVGKCLFANFYYMLQLFFFVFVKLKMLAQFVYIGFMWK